MIDKEMIEKILLALSDCEFSNFQESDCDYFLDAFNHNILPLDDWFNGASKMVLKPSNQNFVIKIPFAGYTTSEENWSEEEQAWLYEEEFLPFDGAYCKVDDSYGWDYCYVETILFQAAKEKGLGDYFLETRFIGKVNGYPIYVQEYISESTASSSSSYSYTENRREKIKSNSDNIHSHGGHVFNGSWQLEFVENFGMSKMLELINFIEEMFIEDLHPNNLGFRKGKPVILDYAGFNC